MPDSSIVSQNLGLIRQAQRGSDVFGVLEKMAFILFSNKIRPTSEQNWFYAQDILAKWEIHTPKKMGWRYEKVPAKLPEELTAQLNKKAWRLCAEDANKIGFEQFRAGRTPDYQEILARINPDKNWFKAMHHLADEIIYGSSYG